MLQILKTTRQEKARAYGPRFFRPSVLGFFIMYEAIGLIIIVLAIAGLARYIDRKFHHLEERLDRLEDQKNDSV